MMAVRWFVKFALVAVIAYGAYHGGYNDGKFDAESYQPFPRLTDAKFGSDEWGSTNWKERERISLRSAGDKVCALG